MIESDYVVVGAGAMGMAFTDTILSETDATVTLIDRRARPGGHWNLAYPFVRLHQPSAFYGVASTPLGTDAIDDAGLNEGLYQLATGTEILAYYDTVLRDRFLAGGRVRFLPMTDYRGGRAVSLLTGESFDVRARRRAVDATYMDVSVPAMRPPTYDIGEGAMVAPVNHLGELHTPADRYVIVGAGKTGVDACLWLLTNGIDPDRITWIMPRDAWYANRADIQPGGFAERSLIRLTGQAAALAESTSIPDVFDRLEETGLLLRLDPDVTPTMYRCATVTTAELAELRRIERIVRTGRVRSIGAHLIDFDDGIEPTSPGTLHIDCTADALATRPARPVFEPGRLVLQPVRHCQQVFSAALIARVEALDLDDDQRNEYCGPIPHPNTDTDWIRSWLASSRNLMTWRNDPVLTTWLEDCRLDPFSMSGSPSRETKVQLLQAARRFAPAIEAAERYVAELDSVP